MRGRKGEREGGRGRGREEEGERKIRRNIVCVRVCGRAKEKNRIQMREGEGRERADGERLCIDSVHRQVPRRIHVRVRVRVSVSVSARASVDVDVDVREDMDK